MPPAFFSAKGRAIEVITRGETNETIDDGVGCCPF